MTTTELRIRLSIVPIMAAEVPSGFAAGRSNGREVRCTGIEAIHMPGLWSDASGDRHEMRVLFYGRLADLLGRELELAAEPGCSIAELRERIAAERPDSAEPLLNRRIRACIGDTIVAEHHVVAPGEQVEFFPPVSGG